MTHSLPLNIQLTEYPETEGLAQLEATLTAASNGVTLLCHMYVMDAETGANLLPPEGLEQFSDTLEWIASICGDDWGTVH
jgi:hypothetical protein